MKLFLFLCTGLACFAQDDAKDTIRRYEGTIGKDMAITLILETKDDDAGGDSYYGTYYYATTGIPISLDAQASLSPKRVFHENSHWDGEKDQISGIWKVAFDEGGVTGTWSSPDGKKSLPITLRETYPDGSAPVEVFHFDSSWSRKRDRKEVTTERAVSFVQLRGDGAGIEKVNAALRELAWIHASNSGEENPPKPPAVISISDIENAIVVTPPKTFSWDEAERNSHESSMEVVMNDRHFLCIRLLDSSYTGGAHGNYGTAHVTFDMKTGELVKIEDWVKPGSEKRWAALGAAQIRSEMGQKPGSPLTESGLFEDALELNQNWFLTPGGIGFSYDPYEIASYAQGIVKFTLPWKDISGDLVPGTAAAKIAATFERPKKSK